MIEDNKVDFLQVTIRKMGDVVNMDPAVLQVGDEVADLLSTSFRRRRVSKVYKEEMLVTGARRVSKVYKEEMLVTGALAYAAGAEFVKYMPCLYPCLSLGLQNFEEHQDAFNVYAYSDESDDDMVEYGNRLRHTTITEPEPKNRTE